MNRVHLILLWHMHQPQYRDPWHGGLLVDVPRRRVGSTCSSALPGLKVSQATPVRDPPQTFLAVLSAVLGGLPRPAVGVSTGHLSTRVSRPGSLSDLEHRL